MIGQMQRSAVIWYAVMSAAATTVLACIWNMLPTGSQPAEISPQQIFFLSGLLAVAIVSFLIGRRFSGMQTSFFEKVAQESRVESEPAP